MQMITSLPRLSLVLLTLGLIALLSGCGGTWDYDPGNYDDSASFQKTLYFYLNAATQDGEALPNVVVWLDGDQQDVRTASSYEQLGNQFPPSWRGWSFNWHSGPVWSDLRDSGGEDRIEMMVSREGYQTQRSHVEFNRWDPQEIYVRQTFVMEPRTGIATAEIVDAPQPAEKWSPGQ